MSLVWRGAAQDVVDKTLGRKEIEANVNIAVERLLSEYPPVP
jgi:hypothetical protein